MNLKRFIVIILLYAATNLHAQVRFSQQYTFGQTTPQLSQCIFTTSTGYLLAGYTSNTVTSVDKGLGILATDLNGNVLWQKQTASATGLHYSNNTANQSFIELKNNKLLFTGQFEYSLNFTRACLAKLNALNGDTIWTKTYKQPGDTSFLLCSTELNDSSIISFGFRYNTCVTCTPNIKPFMMKLDKKGNYKWHKFISANYTSTYVYYQKVIKQSDNDFILIGDKFNGTYNGFIMRIDTNANKLYEVNTNVLGNNNHIFNSFSPLLDGTFIAYGVYNTPSGKLRKLIYQFNGNTGAKIKHMLYNIESNSGGILDVQQKPNGDLIAFGGTGDILPVNTYNMRGDFLWLNTNLDSLKSVYIETPNIADQAASNQAILTPDGGFAVCVASYPAVTQQKFWLIKADSNGCYQAICPTVGLTEAEALEVNVKVWPNPAKEILNIKVNGINSYKVEIINVLGQVIKEQFVEKTELTFDIRDLKVGIYTLQLKTEQGVISKKIVIER